MKPALRPLVLLAGTFAIVWFYSTLLGGVLDGWVRIVVVVVLAIPTWVVVARVVFPALSVLQNQE